METLSQNLSALFNSIIFFKKSMNHFIEEYDYCILSTNFMKEELQKIINFVNKSEIIILNEYEQQNAQFNYKFLIIGFEKNILFVEQSSFELINQIFACKSNPNICFFNNSKKYFDKFANFKYTETKTDLQFLSQISNFEENLSKKSLKQPLLKIWNSIYPCIFGYKIKKSYIKSFQNRIINFKIDDKNLNKTEKISYDEIIEFGSIGSTQQFNAVLAYHIEKEELLVIKKKNGIGNENDNLKKRETENYKEISHPFVPKFYGTIKESNDLVIEFISGNTLDNIKSLHLDEKDKINFILELILVFEYLQSKNFVYRDLKPNNILIDENKIAVLIDYDRMIKYSCSNNNDIISNDNYTADLASNFLAPEVNLGQFSDKNDIYSLGMMIYYIMNEEKPYINKINDSKEKTNIEKLYEMCTKQNPNERPSILELGFNFVKDYFDQIQIENLYEIYEKNFKDISNIKLLDIVKYILENKNTPNCLFRIATLYENSKILTHDYEKAIHYYTLAADLNHAKAQHALGVIYHEGKYVPRDIKKAIHYLALSADQNNVLSQSFLGSIYNDGIYVQRDITKAIHYYTLAAEQKHASSLFFLALIYLSIDINKAVQYLTLASDQNHAISQNYLGILYELGELIPMDIKKAIHYYTLAADQNLPDAQFCLGRIYFAAKYVTRDMDKCIHYFEAAADQNYIDAQFMLGNIYLHGIYIERDINKSIHYFTLASKQNHLDSQFALGVIYYDAPGLTIDINKAIHFFSLAAKQNHAQSLYFLGVIYEKGQYISQDIDKAIDYFTSAAKQNYIYALFELGLIYNSDKYAQHNIEKSIHYYTIAANLNHKESQYNLGVIYYDMHDIKKAMFYLTFAACQNYSQAQYALGYIFYNGQFVPRDINKAIYFLSLAANQNHPKAQYSIGAIYQNGQFVIQDIKKAIYYYNLAVNQNVIEAYYNLGVIYYNGLSIARDIEKATQYFAYAANHNHLNSLFNLGVIYQSNDINKAIDYYTKAANQNHLASQCNLAYIYETGQYGPQDIYKAIYYYKLAADQNQPDAQNNLAVIYLNGKYAKQDITKAIKLLTKSSNQNNPYSQFNLGFLYEKGKGVTVNIEKAIHYYLLSAYQKYSEAQFALGRIYLFGIHVPNDLKKATHFLTLAANQNHSYAQLYLGFFNYLTNDGEKSIKDSFEWLIQASKNGNIYAHFYVGYLYHEGNSLIERDIRKAIQYYKEGSSFNDQFSKNNLGIIYKNGYENEIPKNVQLAIEYFEEAIKKDNDILSIYNLANIYLYDEDFKDDEKSIDLLLMAFDKNFIQSQILLCISLVKKYGFDISNIEKKLNEINGTPINLIKKICKMIKDNKINDELIFTHLYQDYQQIDFLYNFYYGIIQSKNIKKLNIKKKIPEITSDFYDGFSIDLL